MLKNELPRFYQQRLPANWVSAPVVEVKKCQTCLMGQGENSIYSAELKCCTYFPFLPNFMVGEVLAAGGEAANLIKKRIQQREFVLPIGVVAPESYQYKYKNKKAVDFGNREDLLCPFYDQGNCSVWRARSSQCISFQCYSSHGAEGLSFWKELGGFLFELEDYLVQELLIEQGYLWPEIKELLGYVKKMNFKPNSKNKFQLSPETYKRLWAHHYSGMDKFFIKCYELAQNIDLQEFFSTSMEFEKTNLALEKLHKRHLK